jgi:hypothetical protein
MPLNRNTPKIEKINKTSISKTKTFITGPIDNITVETKESTPSSCRTPLKILVNLSTRIILPSYGIVFKSGNEVLLIFYIRISIILAVTTKKSNLFKVSLK